MVLKKTAYNKSDLVKLKNREKKNMAALKVLWKRNETKPLKRVEECIGNGKGKAEISKL